MLKINLIFEVVLLIEAVLKTASVERIIHKYPLNRHLLSMKEKYLLQFLSSD